MTGKGSVYLEAYRKGDRLTQRQAILAKCADCTGNYADGRDDCEMPECSLYPYMPYGKVWKANHARNEEICAESEAASIPGQLEAIEGSA